MGCKGATHAVFDGRASSSLVSLGIRFSKVTSQT